MPKCGPPLVSSILNDPRTSPWLVGALKAALARDLYKATRDANLLAEALTQYEEMTFTRQEADARRDGV